MEQTTNDVFKKNVDVKEKKKKCDYNKIALDIFNFCNSNNSNSVRMTENELKAYYKNATLPDNFKKNPESFFNNFSYKIRQLFAVDTIAMGKDNKIYFNSVKTETYKPEAEAVADLNDAEADADAEAKTEAAAEAKK